MKTENELIAEFLGIRWHENGTVSHYPSVLPMRMGEDYVGDLKFHTSWDWLMPVVDKIRPLVHKIDTDSTAWRRLSGKSIFAKLEDVYKAVVEFIRWYNSQNS